MVLDESPGLWIFIQCSAGMYSSRTITRPINIILETHQPTMKRYYHISQTSHNLMKNQTNPRTDRTK